MLHLIRRPLLALGIVTGLGVAGLAAALELAQAGAEVEVLELGAQPGGEGASRFAGGIGRDRQPASLRGGRNGLPGALELGGVGRRQRQRA